MAEGRTGRVHAGEWRAVSLSFACFFCVLAAYYLIRPVREQLSAAVGSTQLPWFYAATFLATLLLTPVFAALAVRYPRRVLVPVVYGFFIACLLGFVPLFTAQGLLSPRALGTVFFVWVSVFNLFVVSVFWSFMTDIWSNAQARRLFPVIALGGAAGAIAGPALAGTLVGLIGVAALLVVSAALLVVALACVALLGRWAREAQATAHPEAARGAPVAGGMFDGLRQVFADPFMRAMALLMLLGDCIGTINYALVTDYSGATFTDPVARTRFAADVDLFTSVLQVTVQLTLTRWLLVRRGAGAVIAGWAGATVLVLLAVALAPDPHAPVLGGTLAPAFAGSSRWHELAAFARGLPWVALALVVSRGLAYGMNAPARESLFTGMSRQARYLGKNAVDTAVWRFGDLGTATGMNALRGLSATPAVFALIGAGAALVSGTIGLRLSRRIEAHAALPEGAPASR